MPPKRIISVVPSQTELLFDLGLNGEIVGITKFCIHPTDLVKEKTVVGGTKTLNLDRIHDLKPDFILANKEENTRGQIEELQRHYPVHVTDVNNVAEALAMIREVGDWAGRKAEAEQLATQINDSFQTIKSPGHSTGLSVAYFIWRKPYLVAAGQTFIHSMLEWAGFRNAFGDASRYPEVTETDLKTARPDLLFLSSEPFPFSEKHVAELQEICPNTQIVLVDGEIFSWYGSRLLKAADYFRQLRNTIGLL
ncbi:ABC transporter substrate-binding protein [Larkinella rosea]|uniref:Cobalamin-binding protein n=1 Tax=Larkinella rosea TaxID=2025312 RepID=A0A3P1BZX4_9BACT|nr:helical backbone metal receptor [Larkinella rosea]RRB06562.1 cobalamin-binding protein [Larkinella rosea]